MHAISRLSVSDGAGETVERVHFQKCAKFSIRKYETKCQLLHILECGFLYIQNWAANPLH